jgi:hypothetical protein
MKLSLILAAATVASVVASAAPVFAATNAPGATPYCNASQEQLRIEKSQLATELQLSTKQSPTIDDWNNCLKVSYTQDGHNVVAVYDPDGLKLIEKLS